MLNYIDVVFGIAKQTPKIRYTLDESILEVNTKTVEPTFHLTSNCSIAAMNLAAVVILLCLPHSPKMVSASSASYDVT